MQFNTRTDLFENFLESVLRVQDFQHSESFESLEFLRVRGLQGLFNEPN